MRCILICLLVVSSLFAAPYDPQNLTFTNITKNSVTLNWVDNSDDENGFKIFRDDKLIFTLAKDETSYTDRGLKPATDYMYTVKATDDPSDSSYTFKDDEIDYDSEVVEYMIKNIKISENGSVLIDTSKGVFSSSDDNFKVDHEIFKRDGGFDINFFIANLTDETRKLPTLMVPGIQFGPDSKLDILNPLFKHYMQERDLNIENGYKTDSGADHRVDYFSVANLSVKKMVKNIVDTYELHYPYGGQFVYSPVIVAKKNGSGFSVGASLYPMCSDKDGCLRDAVKIHSLMGIKKTDENGWFYEYDLSRSSLEAGKSVSLIISVRFASEKNWIFTLYPYKEFLNSATKDYRTIPSKRDLRPIQCVEMGGFYDDGQGDFHWAANMPVNDDKNLLFKKLFNDKAKELRDNGFQRATFWSITGLYDFDKVTGYENMQEQLPFQFVSREDDFLKKRKIYDDYRSLENNRTIFDGIEIGYDWGISGNIPLNEDYTVLGFDEWLPYDLVKLDPTNESHLNYAQYYINQVKSLKGLFKPKFIRLDAFSRMDQTDKLISDIKRVDWLKKLQNDLPDVTFATESSIDYMHSRAASILQVDSIIKSFIYKEEEYAGDIENEGKIKKPDYLANYLNPQAENYVWVSAEKYEYAKPYFRSLIENGYTPFIEFWGVADVKDIDTTVPECMNGLDDDNDGLVDWPYDSDCSSPSDRNESS